MKNKRGFTIVEIIIVIGLLATIAGIFALNMINTLNKNREEENETIVKEIISAADAYVTINPDKVEALYNGSGFVEIKVGELRDAGFLSETLKDAETGEIIPDERIVKVRVNIEGDFYFEYPVETETSESLKLVANDLYISHNPNQTSTEWCQNPSNTFLGLYHAGNTENGLFLEEVDGKIYGYQNISYNDYFRSDTINLQVQDCNVNPKKAGIYNITYTYHDIKANIDRKKNRVVHVEANSSDVISFTAKFVPTDQLIRYMPDSEIKIQIDEIYKNSKKPYSFVSSVSELTSKGYFISNLSTEEIVQNPKHAIVTRTIVNSDGTSPQNQRVPYTVAANEFTLTMDSDGGTFSDGSSTKSKIVSYKEPYGSLATPTKTGYTFHGWYTEKNGQGENITETTEVKILHAHSIYASWTANTYSVDIINGNPSFGTVEATKLEIEFNGTNQFDVTPLEGYQVGEITCTSGYEAEGYDTLSTETQTVTIKNKSAASNGTCTVKFKRIEYPVDISVGFGGTANKTSIGVPFGDTNTFTVTPNTGYYVSNITCTNNYTATGYNSTSTSTQAILVKNPNTTEGSTCEVSFAKRSYTVSISTSSGGSSSKTSLNVLYGESSTFSVTPNRGYYLSRISCTNGYTANYTSGGVNSQVVSLKNTNVTNNSTCTVSFAKRSFSVSISTGTGGYSSSSRISVPYSGSSTFRVTPNSGYAINSVSCSSGYSASYPAGATAASTVTVRNSGTTATGSCSVSFKKATYTVSIYTSGDGSNSKSSASITSGGVATFTATPSANNRLKSVYCTSGYSASYTSGVTYSQTVTIINNNYSGSGSCTVEYESNGTTIELPPSEDMCYYIGHYKTGYYLFNNGGDPYAFTGTCRSYVPADATNIRCDAEYGTFSYQGHSGCTVTDTYSCSRGCNKLTWHWGRKGWRWMSFPGCTSNANCMQSCSAVITCTS